MDENSRFNLFPQYTCKMLRTFSYFCFMKFNSLIFLVVLSVCLSCKSKPDPLVAEKIDANITDVSSYKPHGEDQAESKDRTIWQQPYKIIELLGPLENKVVADIGAGSGYFAFRFIHKAAGVIAIDIDQQLIDMMNAEKVYYKNELQNKFEARLAKRDNPNLKDAETDIIFFSNTYTYIENRINYLKNLKRCFRPEGRIMIVDFKKKLTPIGPDPNTRMAQYDVEKELMEAGYSIILSDDKTLDYQYIIIATID